MSERDDVDPVIEVHKKVGDRTPLRENLKWTVAQRLPKVQAESDFCQKMHAA